MGDESTSNIGFESAEEANGEVKSYAGLMRGHRPRVPMQEKPQEEEKHFPTNTGLLVKFRSSAAEVVSIDYTGRLPPFGLSFLKAVPLRVKNVVPGGHSGALGVQAGWVVTDISGPYVDIGHEFDPARLKLQEMMRH